MMKTRIRWRKNRKKDGDTSAITFHEIARYDPRTLQGKGTIVAVFDRNATGTLAPFNGMMVAGIHEEPPNAGKAIIKLWSGKVRYRYLLATLLHPRNIKFMQMI